MRAWLEMAIARAKTLSPTSKHLFVWLEGSPIKDFRESWDQACEAVGLPGLLFHDLRRTAARNMICKHHMNTAGGGGEFVPIVEA
jgi:hypothetical protein